MSVEKLSTTLIQNALIPDKGLVDLSIDNGRISAITQAGELNHSEQTHDLNGWLLLPAMAEPHAHLDKALTADQVPNPSGELMGAIKAWIAAAKEGTFTHENTVQRASEAMELLLVHGVTAIRTHVNVTEDIGVSSLEALDEAKQNFEGLLDVQVVALMNSPMTGQDSKGNIQALEAAIEFGVDLLGGCPHLEPAPKEMIRFMFEVAEQAGLGIDFHVDETLDPNVLTLKDLAVQSLERGFPHLLSASHCVSLGMQPENVQIEVAKLVREAGISVFTLPQTNLFLQGRDRVSEMPRGLTAIKTLTDEGVLIAAGADNVRDPFNTMGRSDPFETASLMVMAGHQTPEVAFDLVSLNARKAMGLEKAALEVGDLADFVAVEAPTLATAIADSPMNRRVFKQGILVASADQHTMIHNIL
ncbi:MAG TPA: amidohydrolase family protein [Acidimicrobiales bacterium]|jgi:cytosine deaminase|nr:amidohydrolase family protein [Acidimicrobiales bacterium]HJM97032.1 amidohydrolase family protein [Acidimicrobiales bacterium]